MKLKEFAAKVGLSPTTVSRALCLLLRRPSRSVSDAAFLPVASSESTPLTSLFFFFKVHTHGLLWRPGAGRGFEPPPAQLLPWSVHHWATSPSANSYLQAAMCVRARALHTSGLNFSPQKPAQETSDPGVKCTAIRCVCRFPGTGSNSDFAS